VRKGSGGLSRTDPLTKYYFSYFQVVLYCIFSESRSAIESKLDPQCIFVYRKKIGKVDSAGDKSIFTREVRLSVINC